MPASDQSIKKDRYMLIPRTLIFITRGESVLLLKGAADKKIWPNLYNGVGGHIEKGEDVLSAARRELFEETGLTPDTLWLCGTATIDADEKIGIGLYIMKGVCYDGDLHHSREGELEWVPFHELQAKELVEDLPVILPKVIIHSENDPPFFVHYYYDEDENLVVKFVT